MVVPGLRTRKLDTAVEMRAGETIVLAGPSQAKSSKDGAALETSLLVTVRGNRPLRHERTNADARIVRALIA